MYNEYKTIAGKVLLNVTNFIWGDVMISKQNLMDALVSIGKEEAQYLNTQYEADIAEAGNSDNADEAMAAVTARYKQELLDKGYVLGKDIEVIIHE